MLLRDLLVALPGLIGPTSHASRVQELEVQNSAQLVTAGVNGTATQAAATASPLGQTGFEGVLQQDGSRLSRDTAPIGAQDKDLAQAQPPAGAGPDMTPDQDFGTTSLPDRADPPALRGDAPDLPTGTPIALDTGKLVTVTAGRVATLLPDDDQGPIASVRILDGADWGHVSVNADNSLALVLSGTSQKGTLSFRYEVEYANGKTEDVTTKVKVVAGPQEGGWGLGEHYMLETDAQGSSVIEHGDNHRKVYVSAGRDALSIQDIARLEGIKASQIDGHWLARNGEYGSSADTALDEVAGAALWRAITGSKAEPSSHWLLLESGYTYDELGSIVRRGTKGESELHPVVISSYGEGDRPIIAKSQVYNTPDNANIVIRGLAFNDGLQMLQGKNYLIEDVGIRRDTITAKSVEGFTLRNSDILDVYREDAISKNIWQPHVNRISGVYANGVDGLLIENNLVDHAGWASNYRPNLSLAGGQPPSIYSHGMYLSFDNSDLTLRDNILMRNASFGAQVRSGGVIENNLFLDNNVAVNFLGGHDKGTYGTGNYTLFMNNVVTSGAHRDVTVGPRGGLTMGADNSGRMTAMVGNIITHLADPNNRAELLAKPVTHKPLAEKFAPLYNDTIIFNWVGGKNPSNLDGNNRNSGDLDRKVLTETTIQKFAADLLDKPGATIGDLAGYLRDQAGGKLDGHVDADIINAFFRAGFGLDTTLREQSETLRFTPNDLADGIRWDNRLNWSTGDLPTNGDNIDLGGNHVRFSAKTVVVDHFDFGDGGRLTATSGKLTVTGETSAGPRGAVLDIDRAGQVWLDGYDDASALRINVSGGRLANTGTMDGHVDLTVSDNGQAILASAGGRLVLDGDSSLTLQGSRAKAGFDGTGNDTAVLKMEQGSDLRLVADAKGFSKIAEFRSGAFGNGPDLQSGIALDGELQIDLSGLGRLDPRQDSRWTILQADEIIGTFDNVDIDGLGRRQDVLLRIDYDLDTVTLALSAEGRGSGRVRVVTVGEEDFHSPGDAATQSLWDELHLTL